MRVPVLASLIVACVDPSSASNTLHHIELQNIAVQKLFPDWHYGKNVLADHFFGPETRDRTDVCQWRGVECDGRGAMTTLVLVQTVLGIDMRADPRWLPPTLEFVRICHGWALDGLETSNFPRDIRYFYIAQSDAILGDKIDFRRLPQKMEELFLNTVIFRGPVFLTELPETMRILYVTTQLIARPIFVDNAALPDELAHVFIAHRGSKRKSPYRAVDPKEIIDRRLRFARSVPNPVYVDSVSKYNVGMYATASDLMQTYIRDNDGPGFDNF